MAKTLRLDRGQYALFETHRNWAEGFGRRLCGAHLPPCFEVADVVQAALIGLAKAARLFDAGRGVPFQAFAHPYVQGECFMLVRRRNYESARYEELPVTIEGPRAKQPDIQVEAHLANERLDKALAHLEPAELAAVRALFWEQVSLAVLAARLGMSTGEAARTRDRALERLRLEVDI